jgi:hypothetical protein
MVAGKPRTVSTTVALMEVIGVCGIVISAPVVASLLIARAVLIGGHVDSRIKNRESIEKLVSWIVGALKWISGPGDLFNVITASDSCVDHGQQIKERKGIVRDTIRRDPLGIARIGSKSL